MRFHGATFNYMIDYKNITRAFLLPIPDETHMAFVFGLEKSIAQGQTAYPYIVMQIKKEFEEDVKIKITQQEAKEAGWNELQEE